MKAISLTVIILFITLYYSRAQNRIDQWMGGNDLMINFSSGHPVAQKRTDGNLFFRTDASISDSAGNLLFYTNGFRVLNKNEKLMQNGDSLDIGDYITWGYNSQSIVDGATVIPVPNKSSQYYLFHFDLNFVDTFPLVSTHLFYSLIKMGLDNGLGGIDSGIKNIPLLTDTFAGMGMKAVKHANGRDYWLLCHKYASNKYFKFLVDPYGIHGPYDQDIGFIYENNNSSLGTMKFSPDGSLFASLVPISDTLELYDFDRCTGELYNYRCMPIDTPGIESEGICFSPSQQYLYVTHRFTQIFQFDITASNILSTKKIVGTDNGVVDPFLANYNYEDIGPDGKIYINCYDFDYALHVINQPDSNGTACDFIEWGFPIGAPSDIGPSFPNIVNYALGALPGACDTVYNAVPLPTPLFTYSVYPNPFVKQLNVSISGAQTDAEISVFNLVGQQVYYTKQKQSNNFVYSNINLSSLVAGMYIITVRVNGRQYERKVVKK